MNALLAAVAGNNGSRVPRALQQVVDPMHVFAWAANRSDNAALSQFETRISPARHRELAPSLSSTLDRAVEAAAPQMLLSPLIGLSQADGSVSPIDYSSAYRTLLETLVTAVAAMPDERQASREAAKHLYMRHCATRHRAT